MSLEMHSRVNPAGLARSEEILTPKKVFFQIFTENENRPICFFPIGEFLGPPKFSYATKTHYFMF